MQDAGIGKIGNVGVSHTEAVVSLGRLRHQSPAAVCADRNPAARLQSVLAAPASLRVLHLRLRNRFPGGIVSQAIQEWFALPLDAGVPVMPNSLQPVSWKHAFLGRRQGGRLNRCSGHVLPPSEVAEAPNLIGTCAGPQLNGREMVWFRFRRRRSAR